jgi:hypothetical protein
MQQNKSLWTPDIQQRIDTMLERRENAKHVIEGEIIDGKIKVWERCPHQADKGWLHHH